MSAAHVHGLQARFLTLTATRWLQVGLVFGLTVLLPLGRGLDLAEVGVLLSIQGFVVLVLEVPSGTLADALGRKPVLLLAGATAIASTAIIVSASAFWMFAAALVLQGVFRALDSGPLESWFVDALGSSAPPSQTARALGHASTVLGIALAAGAAVSGVLVWWAPVPGADPLVLPFLVALVVQAAHVVLVAVLVHEHRRPTTTDPGATGRRRRPRPWSALASAAALVRDDRVLLCLILVEVSWSLAMIGFETLAPVRLAELTGSTTSAAALFGPASAVAWGVFAGGSALCSLLAPRIGAVAVAIGARVLNGLFVATMGLLAGVPGLLVGYSLAYLAHGAAGPAHSALLHARATADTRATVLSLNSLVAGGSISLLLLVVLPLSETLGTVPVLVTCGLLSAAGAVLYLPALRAHATTGRRRRADPSLL